MTAGDFAVLGLIDVRDDPPSLVSSRAVGYGISQITPIVVQSLLSENGMLSSSSLRFTFTPLAGASRRSAHQHRSRTRQSGPRCETHSEHLVLRLLRRVREGVLDPDDLSILYVDLWRMEPPTSGDSMWIIRATLSTVGPVGSSMNDLKKCWANVGGST